MGLPYKFSPSVGSYPKSSIPPSVGPACIKRESKRRCAPRLGESYRRTMVCQGVIFLVFGVKQLLEVQEREETEGR